MSIVKWRLTNYVRMAGSYSLYCVNPFRSQDWPRIPREYKTHVVCTRSAC